MFEKKGANRSKEVEPEAPLSEGTRAFEKIRPASRKPLKRLREEETGQSARKPKRHLRERRKPLVRDRRVCEKTGAHHSKGTGAFEKKEQTARKRLKHLGERSKPLRDYRACEEKERTRKGLESEQSV